MKKIKTLFKMDDRHRMTRIPQEGSEGVFSGDWIPRLKIDGSACMVRNGKLYKRYDRKLDKKGRRKIPPAGWMACENNPDPITGHWPGWAPVIHEDKYHTQAWDIQWLVDGDGTYELMGTKVQGNPYGLIDFHALVKHSSCRVIKLTQPITWDSLREDLTDLHEEGIVFHGPDDQFFKLRRRDFGFNWPVPQ